MKLVTLYLLIQLICASLAPNTHSLTIQIAGFEDNSGKSFVGLYRNIDRWPEIKKQFIGKVVVIKSKTATAIFNQLPPGKYAVAVFHDKNNNGIMDKNLVGMPTERYGFSNNVRELFSAPSFNDAAIDLSSDRTIGITVK
jgi:uncharacterized protein (DUF2141 family)